MESNSRHTRFARKHDDLQTTSRCSQEDRHFRNCSLNLKQRQRKCKNMHISYQRNDKKNYSLNVKSCTRSYSSKQASLQNFISFKSEKNRQENNRCTIISSSQSSNPSGQSKYRSDPSSHAVQNGSITSGFRSGHKRKLEEQMHKYSMTDSKSLKTINRQQVDFEQQSLILDRSFETSAEDQTFPSKQIACNLISSASSESTSGVEDESQCEIDSSKIQHEINRINSSSPCHGVVSEEKHEYSHGLDQVALKICKGIAALKSEPDITSPSFNKAASIVHDQSLFSNEQLNSTNCADTVCRQSSLTQLTFKPEKVINNVELTSTQDSTGSNLHFSKMSGMETCRDSCVTSYVANTFNNHCVESQTGKTTVGNFNAKDSGACRSNCCNCKAMGKSINKSNEADKNSNCNNSESLFYKKKLLNSSDICNSHTEACHADENVDTELPITHITCTSNLILLGDEETTCTTFTSPSKYQSLPSELYPPGVRGDIHDRGSHVRHIRGQTEVIKNLQTKVSYSHQNCHKKAFQTNTATDENNLSKTLSIRNVSKCKLVNPASTTCISADISKNFIMSKRMNENKKQKKLSSKEWGNESSNFTGAESKTGNNFKKLENKDEGTRESEILECSSFLTFYHWPSTVKEMYGDVFKKAHHAFKQEMVDQANSEAMDVKRQCSFVACGNTYTEREKSAPHITISDQSKNPCFRSAQRPSSPQNLRISKEKSDLTANLLYCTVKNVPVVDKDSKKNIKKQAAPEKSQKMTGYTDSAVKMANFSVLSPDSYVVTSSDYHSECPSSPKPIQSPQCSSYESVEKVHYHEPDSTSDTKTCSDLTMGSCAKYYEHPSMQTNFIEKKMCDAEKWQLDNGMKEHFKISEDNKSSHSHPEQQPRPWKKARKFRNNESQNFISAFHSESLSDKVSGEKQDSLKDKQYSTLCESTSVSDKGNINFEIEIHPSLKVSAHEDSDKTCCCVSECNERSQINSVMGCTSAQTKIFSVAASDKILNMQHQEAEINDFEVSRSVHQTNLQYVRSIPRLAYDEISLIEDGSLSEFDGDILHSFADDIYSSVGGENNIYNSPSKHCFSYAQKSERNKVEKIELTACNTQIACKLPPTCVRLESELETVGTINTEIRMASTRNDKVTKSEEDPVSRHKTFQELQQQMLVKRSFMNISNLFSTRIQK